MRLWLLLLLYGYLKHQCRVVVVAAFAAGRLRLRYRLTAFCRLLIGNCRLLRTAILSRETRAGETLIFTCFWRFIGC